MSFRARFLPSIRPAVMFVLLGALIATHGVPVLAQTGEPLTLRLSDTEVRPGEVAAVVVRTYEPRGVGQGQLCLRAIDLPSPPGVVEGVASKGTGSPFVDLEGVVVFSGEDDAVTASSFDPLDQTAVLDFESLSGTINSTDGPLAVLFFRVDPSLTPGSVFELQFDGETFLQDPTGTPIPVEIRGGELEILAPSAPLSLGAEGDRVAPGMVARIGVATAEQLLLGGGEVTLLYDPAIADGMPVVTLDPRHGSSVFSADVGTPGRVEVSFDSPDGTLNTVPGQLISIDLPTRADLPIGTLSAISIDPASQLEDAAGVELALVLDSDVIEFVEDEGVFADSFESGDLSEWDLVFP